MYKETRPGAKGIMLRDEGWLWRIFPAANAHHATRRNSGRSQLILAASR